MLWAVHFRVCHRNVNSPEIKTRNGVAFPRSARFELRESSLGCETRAFVDPVKAYLCRLHFVQVHVRMCVQQFAVLFDACLPHCLLLPYLAASIQYALTFAESTILRLFAISMKILYD